MKWRFVDRIDQFEPWRSVSGRKSISLEEYSLLGPLGRKGCLPESLVVEVCVQLGRWLVAVSSCFEQSCILLGVDGFGFSHETMPGHVLSISAEVLTRSDCELEIGCVVFAGAERFAEGRLALSLVPLRELCVAEDVKTLWGELYVEA